MYDELLKENGQLEAKIKQLQQTKQAAQQKTGQAPKVTGQVSQPVSAAPSTIDGIIHLLAGLRPGFGDAVSELSAQLIAEASTLQELRRNVEQEQQELESLHGLEVSDDTLEQLLQKYQEKTAEFEAQTKERQEIFEQETAEKRSVWQKEQTEHTRFVKERDEAAKKVKQREAAEYTYDLEHQRKLDIDAYTQAQEQLKNALQELELRKKKEWAEREKQIAEQETEHTRLQSQVEKFPKELESSVKKAKDEASAIARRQIKMKADVRAKEAEGERRVYELKIQSLEDTITTQRQRIQLLSSQLDAAVKQTQDLAIRAIEGTSTSGSLQAVKEIALEQAKQGQKSK